MKSDRIANTGFLSLVLATLIFLVGLFAFKLSIDERHAQKDHPIAQHSKDEVAREGTVLGIGAEGWTAIFTGGLFVFTMALAVFTYRLFRVTKDGIAEQAAMTRESLATAERSALAAERALEGADAPFVSVIPEINATKQPLIGGRISLQFMRGKKIIRYSLINYGKSPAMVLEIYRGMIVSNCIPEPIGFPPPQTNLHKVQIVGPDKKTPEYYVEQPEIAKAGGDETLSWADEGKKSDPLWISFQIRYRDSLGGQFVSEHTFAFNPVYAEFYPQGGTRHNYRRKLTDKELAEMELRDAL